MKFAPLEFDAPDAFEQRVQKIHDRNVKRLGGQPVPEYARELLDSGIEELRTALPDLGDRDIARVLMVAGYLSAQLIARGPEYDREIIMGTLLNLAEQLWRQDMPGAAKLLEMVADAQAGGDAPDDPAFDALEALHARIARDFHFDASESAPPDDERWARVMDDLVNYADELYLPLANARLGIAEPQFATEADPS